MNELYIYDDIGPEWMGMVGAKTVIDALAKIGSDNDVTVRINSPGGSVTEGQAMYNALRRHKGKVRVAVDSLAASMGSYVAMAGDEIEIAANAMFMIHAPWTVGIGNADQLREQAGILDKFELSAAEVYAARSGQDLSDVQQMMKDETWLTAKDAVELGFANVIGQELNAQASVKEGRFMKTPARFLTLAVKRDEVRQGSIDRIAAQLKLSRSRLGV